MLFRHSGEYSRFDCYCTCQADCDCWLEDIRKELVLEQNNNGDHDDTADDDAEEYMR
jgi:hypothetical protein